MKCVPFGVGFEFRFAGAGVEITQLRRGSRQGRRQEYIVGFEESRDLTGDALNAADRMEIPGGRHLAGAFVGEPGHRLVVGLVDLMASDLRVRADCGGEPGKPDRSKRLAESFVVVGWGGFFHSVAEVFEQSRDALDGGRAVGVDGVPGGRGGRKRNAELPWVAPDLLGERPLDGRRRVGVSNVRPGGGVE